MDRFDLSKYTKITRNTAKRLWDVGKPFIMIPTGWNPERSDLVEKDVHIIQQDRVKTDYTSTQIFENMYACWWQYHAKQYPPMKKYGADYYVRTAVLTDDINNTEQIHLLTKSRLLTRWDLSVAHVEIEWLGYTTDREWIRLSVQFSFDGKVIFPTFKMNWNPRHEDTWDSAVCALVAIDTCCIGQGDTDEEYFEGYTSDQLSWANERNQDRVNLQCTVHDELDRYGLM